MIITPAVGQQWPEAGGIYAGLVGIRHMDGDRHLIVGPEFDGSMNWYDASAWAATLSVGGFFDWYLPTRGEQQVMMMDVPELFPHGAYWSSEQHAGDRNNAYTQNFSEGLRTYCDKVNLARARAVRSFFNTTTAHNHAP
jgi:hypothetical protein